MTEFRIEAFHNTFLPRGARGVQAVITVTAVGTGRPDGSTFGGSAPEDRSELLIVDVLDESADCLSALVVGSRVTNHDRRPTRNCPLERFFP